MKADLSVEDGHLCNMGKMIEELEGKLRNQLDQVSSRKNQKTKGLFGFAGFENWNWIPFQSHV